MDELQQATLHALVMMVLIVGALAYAILARGRPRLLRVVAAIAAGLATFLVLGMLGVHACGRGIPGHQIIIGALSVALVVLLVRARRGAILAALALFIGYGALVMHFNQLAHGQRTNGSARVWGPKTDAAGKPRVITVEPLWHSWISGLYARRVDKRR